MSDGPERDEKTEEATARRREESRDKGQVAFSSEIMVAAMLIAAVAGMATLGSRLAYSVGGLFEGAMAPLAAGVRYELDVSTAAALLVLGLRTVVPSVLLMGLPMICIGLLVGFGQVGIHFAGKAIEADISKIDPIKGFQKIFSPRSWMRTFLGALKVVLIASVMIAVTLRIAPAAGNITDTGARPLLAVIGYVLMRATAAGLLVLLVLALVDFVFQRIQHAKDLRMTKKEIRDEARNTEGDPLVKSRIRQLQRELSSRRMMSDVPKATVIVTNPTHVAVALRYDDDSKRAPIVVAKGLDEVAQAIKRIGAEHNVIIYEEPPLARALHRSCEIGDAIPAEMFEAVAKVLAYVYRIQGRAPVTA